jgi:hypothetical protein
MADGTSEEVGNSICEGRGDFLGGRDGLELGADFTLKIFGLVATAGVELETVDGAKERCEDSNIFGV